MMNKILRNTLVAPMEIAVASLKKVRKYLHVVSQKKKKGDRPSDLSPEKEAEIEARRKVSPRKRKPMSLLDQVRRTAFGVLGYKDVRIRQIMMEKSESELSREDAERKRKHDEILTDQGSESEETNDDDLADFDLDNYESEEDPDYEPSESEFSSEDITDAETESDIEYEKVGGIVQLKEKGDKSTEIAHSDKKTPKPVDQSKDMQKDTKPKDEKKKAEEKKELPKDEKKSQPTTPKSKKEPSKDEKKPHHISPKDKKSQKQPEKSEAMKDEKPKHKHGENIAELPKDIKLPPPQSDKLSEPIMNGDKKPDDKLKFGKYFDK